MGKDANSETVGLLSECDDDVVTSDPLATGSNDECSVTCNRTLSTGKLNNYGFIDPGGRDGVPKRVIYKRQLLLLFLINLNMICTGMSMGWSSPVLVKLRNETETVLPEPITEQQGSWMVSIGYLVSVFTTSLSSPLQDNIGRKYALIIICIPRIAAAFLLIFANDVWMLILSRAVSGAAESMTMVVTSVYASEVASKEIRGALGTFLQMSASLGTLIMLSMGPFLAYVPLNIIFTVATTVAVIPIFFLPDSPYFLYSKGRIDESTKALIFLRGSPEAAKDEIKEYAASSNDSKINKRKLFKDKQFLKSLGIVLVIGFGSQLIGFNAISFYLQTILESTQTSIRDDIASVTIGCIQLSACFVTAFILDRFGRKPILGSMLTLNALGLFGLGSFFQIRDNSDGGAVTGFMNILPLISLMFVVFGYSAGPGAVFWLLITELFEGPARALGVSCCSVVCTLAVFLTARYFAAVSTNFGPAVTYWFFGVTCVLLNLFVLIIIPETKGKSFAEIQVALGAKRRVDTEKESQDNNGSHSINYENRNNNEKSNGNV